MRCFVICCNDSVMKVVVANKKEAAEAVLEVLANEDFEQHKHHWLTEWQLQGGVRFKRTGYEYYRHRLYWHINETTMTTMTEVAVG